MELSSRPESGMHLVSYGLTHHFQIEPWRSTPTICYQAPAFLLQRESTTEPGMARALGNHHNPAVLTHSAIAESVHSLNKSRRM